MIVKKAVKLNPKFFNEIADIVMSMDVIDGVENSWRYSEDGKLTGAYKARKKHILSWDLIANAWYIVHPTSDEVMSYELQLSYKDIDESVIKCLMSGDSDSILMFDDKVYMDLYSFLDSDGMSKEVYEKLKDKGYILEESQLSVDKIYIANRDLVCKDYGGKRDLALRCHGGPDISIPKGSEIRIDPDDCDDLIVKVGGKEYKLYVGDFKAPSYKLCENGKLKSYVNIYDIIIG